MKRSTTYAFLFCLWLYSFSQQLDYEFIHFNSSNGLSQSSIMAIEQDHDGLMWFGTRDGLNQFDGEVFRTFRSNSRDSTSISNNDILDLEVGKNGDLWIGTTNGLNRFNRETETFQRFYKEPENPLSLPSNTIREVLMSKNHLWIGTPNGLSILNPETGSFYNYGQNRITIDKQIIEIVEDQKENIWIGTAQGLYKVVSYENGQLDLHKIEAFKGNFVQSLIANEGKLYIGTKHNGIKVLDIATELVISKILPPTIANSDVRALAFDLNGNLWIGSYNGLNILSKNGKMSHIAHEEYNENSLSKNTIKSIFLDKQGSIWVGTYYGGVNLWNDANFNFHYIKKNTSGAGLGYNVVSAIDTFGDELAIATEGGGITIKKESGGYRYLNTENSKLPSNNVKSLHRDGQKLLIGTFNAGLSIYDFHSNSFIKTYNTQNGLPHNSVYSIAKLEENYWIGTYGGGIVLYDTEKEQLRTFSKTQDNNTSLSDNQVRVVYANPNRGLWIGTQNGLNHLSIENIRLAKYDFEKYLFDPADQSGEDILSIFEDKSGRLYVGTKEKGLYIKEGAGFMLIELFTDIPNASNTVHSMEQGAKGELWISTNNGILRYDPVSGNKQLFKESDGLISNEFNSSASFKDDLGKLYFGGPSGISYFSPDQMKHNDYAPAVVLTDFYLADKRIIPKDDSNILSTNLMQSKSITLNYDQSIFSIRFALPNYVNPKKNSYAYRLKGLSDWTYSNSNTASYTIQQSGTYTFEVKGKNNDDVWSDEVTSLKIIVKPAPWKTPLAFLGYAVAIALALYFLIKTIQSHGNLERNLMIEHETNEREKLINQLKLQFFTNISHEFRTPLTLIVGPLQRIIQDYRGSSKLYKQILMVEKNAQQLLKLINQLMDFRKLENNQSNLRTAEGNIVKFVNEVFISFQTHAKNEGYDYSFKTTQESILAFYDRDKMERILYNLISNAFKFTPREGTVAISIDENDADVLITVQDSGMGISGELISRIFDRFYQIGQHEVVEEKKRGTGIGLALVKGLIELHKGSISVESQGIGKGSKFTISLPKGNDHLTADDIIEDFKDSENIQLYKHHNDLEILNDHEELVADVKVKSEKKLLVVEDNDELRSFILSLLDNYELLEARNGKEGLEIAIKELPDLILSDVMMPEMNGISLCHAIKNDVRLSHIPVILVTARTSLLFKYEGLESGADDYINKPFNIRELKLKIKNLLSVVENLKNRFKDEGTISPSDVTLSSIDEELLKKAIEIVDGNISNEFFDVLLFCNELGVSRTMLFTKVKAWTNLTPNEFIFGMRMKRAADLLEKGSVNVSRVCFEVGYKDPKYFSKSFQKYHGLSPSKYAKKFKETSQKA